MYRNRKVLSYTCMNCKKVFLTDRYSGRCQNCLESFHHNKVGFGFIPTERFLYYYKNKGNISRSRVEMFKKRCLVPDGNGEVVTRNSFGKITDKLAKI